MAAEAMFAAADPAAAKQALEDGILRAMKGKLKKVDAEVFAEQFMVDLTQTQAEQAKTEPAAGPLPAVAVDPAAVPGFARTADQKIDLASRTRAAPAAPAEKGQLKLFSRSATFPTGRIVFSHWGDAPSGVTDPARLGTGVRGAEWEPAKRAGLVYTSAVVRGTDYKESAVIGSGRKQYVGSIPADRVYTARADDRLRSL